MPVTKDWFGPGNRQNKQSRHQTMMKKGWNRCPTQKNKVMERMTPLKRWNGLAWVCTVWLWKGLARGGVCSGTTVFPQTQHVRLVRFSLFGCDLTTSISSKGIQGQAMENTVCESAQTDDCAGNHPRSTPSRCFAQRSSRARGLIRGWIQTAWNGLQTALRTGFLPKKVTKEANQQGVSW